MTTIFGVSLVLVLLVATLYSWQKVRNENGRKRFLSLLETHVTENWFFNGQGSFRLNQGEALFCPIAWICYRVTNRTFSCHSYDHAYEAAKALRLPRAVARKIIRAVDKPATYLRERDKQLRWRIQEILNIPSTISK